MTNCKYPLYLCLPIPPPPYYYCSFSVCGKNKKSRKRLGVTAVLGRERSSAVKQPKARSQYYPARLPRRPESGHGVKRRRGLCSIREKRGRQGRVYRPSTRQWRGREHAPRAQTKYTVTLSAATLPFPLCYGALLEAQIDLLVHLWSGTQVSPPRLS